MRPTMGVLSRFPFRKLPEALLALLCRLDLSQRASVLHPLSRRISHHMRTTASVSSVFTSAFGAVNTSLTSPLPKSRPALILPHSSRILACANSKSTGSTPFPFTSKLCAPSSSSPPATVVIHTTTPGLFTPGPCPSRSALTSPMYIVNSPPVYAAPFCIESVCRGVQSAASWCRSNSARASDEEAGMDVTLPGLLGI